MGNPGFEREWERRRELRQAVLLHLTSGGSAKWGVIDRHFYQEGKREIAEARFDVTHQKRIALELPIKTFLHQTLTLTLSYNEKIAYGVCLGIGNRATNSFFLLGLDQVALRE